MTSTPSNPVQSSQPSIVERLRVWPAAYGEDAMSSTYVGGVMKDAANQIEALAVDLVNATRLIHEGGDYIVKLINAEVRIQELEKALREIAGLYEGSHGHRAKAIALAILPQPTSAARTAGDGK